MLKLLSTRKIRGLALLASLSSCFVACSDETTQQQTGNLGFALVVSPEVRLGTVNYAVSGNGFNKAGTIDASASTQITGRVGGLPAGQGFSLLLTATAANDPTVKCEGSATFNVLPGAVTQVAIKLLCRQPPKTGTVVINGKVNVCPVIDSVDVLPGEAFVGGAISMQVAARDSDAAPSALAYAWTSTVGAVTGGASTSASTLCSNAGTGSVTITVTDGDCSDSVTVAVVCTPNPTVDAGAPQVDSAPTAPPNVKVNEVESSGGSPGDWAEIFNAGSTPADVSNWVFKDNDDTHVYVIPAGTILAPGAFLALEEAGFGFGLGGGDSARLYDASGTLVDTYTWTAHAAITYGRCPDGTGAFGSRTASTKGAANACAPVSPPDAGAADAQAPAPDASASDAAFATVPWQGLDNVVTVDLQNQFGDNLSGLNYQAGTSGAPDVLWGVVNSPSLIHRMLWNGTNWAFDAANDWSAGKNVRYPSGTGNPDCEGIARAEEGSPFMYVSTERNNDASSVSRLSILRVNLSTVGTQLVALNEWNLNADLPVVGANLGLESITFIPDRFLVANGLRDRNTNLPYNPAAYPNHGTGLLFVGVEGTGMIHGYALDHTGSTFNRVVSFASGQTAVMDLAFDQETGNLWSACDNSCGNTAAILSIVGGDFVLRKKVLRPSTLADSNNEGITFAPETQCVGGAKPFFWSDDSHFGGFALRRGSVACGTLF